MPPLKRRLVPEVVADLPSQRIRRRLQPSHDLLVHFFIILTQLAQGFHETHALHSHLNSHGAIVLATLLTFLVAPFQVIDHDVHHFLASLYQFARGNTCLNR
jgi:hypothetical protein